MHELRVAKCTSGMYLRQKESSDVEMEYVKAKLRSRRDADQNASRALRRLAERVAELAKQVALSLRFNRSQEVWSHLLQCSRESSLSRIKLARSRSIRTKFSSQVQGTNSLCMSRVQQMQKLLGSSRVCSGNLAMIQWHQTITESRLVLHMVT